MIKLCFLDFWGDFDVNKNFFFFLLSKIYDVQVTTDPNKADIIIYSLFGEEHKKYNNALKIFYTGENYRPKYDECDLAFSFDFTDHEKNIRVPLWLLQIDWFNQTNYGNPNYTLPLDQLDDNFFSKKNRTEFCCTVFNSPSPFRYEMFTELSKYKPVHGYGKPFGNWFYGEDKKYNILSNYKFTICFENSIYPGYYTEKPIHAKSAGCIPIYWSDENMSKDFNSNGFINLSSFNNDVRSLVDYIIKVDQDDELYQKIRKEKLFNDLQDPRKLIDNILNKIKSKL